MNIEPEYAQTDIMGNELSEDEKQWLDENKDDLLLDPFATFNWRTADSRDHWDNMEDMAVGSNEAEWLSVLDDRADRKAAIIHMGRDNADQWLERVGEHGLAYRQIRWTAPYDGFAHESPQVDPHDPERLSYAVIAQNEDVADKMVEAETEMAHHERHKTVGKLLGFPECCRNFFAETWYGDNMVDPMYEITCNSDNVEPIAGNKQNLRVVDPDPWNNVLYRYWGWTFLTHMPCSWDCEHSKEVAKTRGEIMADNGYRGAANDLWEWLREPMQWTSIAGQCQVKNKHMLGASGSSQYFSRKRIEWKQPHAAEWRDV